jgi:ATP-binding cassette subfamily C protein CydC
VAENWIYSKEAEIGISTGSSLCVKVSDSSFAYGSGKEIFRNASFSMEHPSIMAIVGRSGLGKTTFLRLISGLCDGYRGQIEVFGRMPVEARIGQDKVGGHRTSLQS